MSKLLTADFHPTARLRSIVWGVSLAILCLLVEPSMAGPRRFARTIDTHTVSQAPRPQCLSAFGNFNQFQTVDTIYTDTEEDGVTQTRSISETRLKDIDAIVLTALEDWVKSRDYTMEQALMLYERDQKLDPRRTKYIHLENGGSPAILRIFDGSTEVLTGGTPWGAASRSSSLSPMEMGSPGFIIPERAWEQQDPKRKSYFWEISLLDVDRQLQDGVETIFQHVASLLDLHYNNKEMDLFGRTNTLETRKMMIYAQVRPNRVAIFQKYGFQPILQVDPLGQIAPFEVAKNSVFIAMKAEDFLKRYDRKKNYPRRKTDAPEFIDEDAHQRDRNKISEHINSIESNPFRIHTMNEMMVEFQKVFLLYVRARTLQGMSVERRDVIIQFFEEYLRLIASIPVPMKHSNYTNLQNVVRELMMQPDPYTAFYYFAKSMDENTGQTVLMNNLDRSQFYATRPRSIFKLVAPTQPMPVLSYTPIM